MDKKDITYVCFVQNNLGILDGEEVVSAMIITKKKEIVDKWLIEQINEAKENGYTPDENVDEFIGKTDYYDCYLTVSKGNEEEGFDSYGFVCRPFILEEDYENGKYNQ